MHGHDRFEQSNQDLVGLWRGNLSSAKRKYDEEDEVVVESPTMEGSLGVSTFGARAPRPAPIKTKDLQSNLQSHSSESWSVSSGAVGPAIAHSPTLRLDRDRLIEVLQSLAAQNKGSSLIEIFKSKPEE